MKRFHVHLSVDDLDASVRFYSSVFGSVPNVLKADYAKWMLEDPRVNFAISTHGRHSGVDHLGLQVDSDAELSELRERAAAAEITALDQKNATCCYALSDKYWITDPQGIAWETFHTLDSAPLYGESIRPDSKPCCGAVPDVSSTKSGACCPS